MTVVNLSDVTNSSVSTLSKNGISEEKNKVSNLQSAFSTLLKQSSSKNLVKQEGISKEMEPNKAKDSYIADEKEAVAEKIPMVKPQVEEKIQKDELSQKSEEISAMILNLLGQTFGITTQEIQQMLDQQNLTPMELLQPSNLAQIVGVIQNDQDFMGLLNSEEFQTVLTEMGEITNELLEEFGITKTQLQSLCEAIMNDKSTNKMQSPEMIINEQLEEENNQIPQNIVKISNEDAKAIQIPVESPVTDNHQIIEKMNQLNNQAQIDSNGSGEENQKLIKVDSLTEAITEATEESLNSDLSGETDQENQSEMDFRNKKSNVSLVKPDFLTNQNKINPSIPMAKVIQTLPTSVDLSSLMDRIHDFTKISLGNQISSMEMQLNPENLGKVFVTVTSQHGEVSAHIAAQTVAAKEAIESQIGQFRENLAQNGIKVQAVEVTIASHEFERDLSGQEQKFQQEQPEKRQNRRRMLNQETLQQEFLSGVMTEDDQVIANMMKDQGNSMDYQV